MIDVLIVDDNADKQAEIRKVLDHFPEIPEDRIDVASDLVTARRLMEEKRYDLLILDLLIPNRFDQSPMLDGGANFLEELEGSLTLYKPFHIIGVTAYDDARERYGEAFESRVWALLKYIPGDAWFQEAISKKISYLIQSKRDLTANTTGGFQVDLGIITALGEPEFGILRRFLSDPEEVRFPEDESVYHKGWFKKGERWVSVAAICTHQMGTTASAIATMKLCQWFRPRFVCIVGIAAGYRNECNLGDILVVDSNWEYSNGKLRELDSGDILFEPAPHVFQLDFGLRELFQLAKDNGLFVDEIKKSFDGEAPDTSLRIKIGPVVSGPYVVASAKKFDEIRGQHRKIVGLEMEIAGVFHAAMQMIKPKPIPFALKSVCDFGDNKKGDGFQRYAAYTSASFLYHFSTDMLFERIKQARR